jgi:hypothetical protein
MLFNTNCLLFFYFYLFIFETKAHYVAQAGFELVILLYLFLKYQDYRMCHQFQLQKPPFNP